MVRFDCSKQEAETIRKIVKRVLTIRTDLPDLDMDITACHMNAIRLDLTRLLIIDDFNFMHDVLGIHENLNRKTGKLDNCFLPRCSL